MNNSRISFNKFLELQLGIYTAGTVIVTNNSATVTGAGTKFIGSVTPGQTFRLNSNMDVYTVKTVDSDTQLTLTAKYTKATARGQYYSVYTIPLLAENQYILDYPCFKIDYLSMGNLDKKRGKNYHFIQLNYFDRLDSSRVTTEAAKAIQKLGFIPISIFSYNVIPKYDWTDPKNPSFLSQMVIEWRDTVGWRVNNSDPKIRHLLVDLYLYFMADNLI